MLSVLNWGLSGECGVLKGFVVLTLLLVSSQMLAGVLHFEHADVLYPEGYRDLAVYVGNVFESYRDFVIELIGNDPGRVVIVLQDLGTLANGSANPFVHNTIQAFVWPPEGHGGWTLPVSDWYTGLVVHEFAHLCHLTMQDELSRILSLLLGIPHYPQLSSPYVEGTTLFVESGYDRASGRLNNPAISSGMFYHWLRNFPSFNYKELLPFDDYRCGELYYNLTGGFYQYLARTYGVESVKKFLKATTKALPIDVSLGEDKPDDPYVYVFGKSFDELYTDWIFSLTKLDYAHGELIHKEENGLILRLDVGPSNGQLSFVVQTLGPMGSYLGLPFTELKVLENGKVLSSSTFPVGNDFKLEGDERYALVASFDGKSVCNVVWDVARNVAIASGKISAFDIRNGNPYLATFNPVSRETTVKGPSLEFKVACFVKNMAATDEYVALLTLQNDILVYDHCGRLIRKVSDRNLKGPYIKVWKDGLLFARVEGDYVVPYYYDVKNDRFYRLADKTLVLDFTIVGKELYYVSYVPYGKTGGTGVYKTAIEFVEFAKLPNEVNEPTIRVSEHEFTEGNELAFRVGKFLTPLTWTPRYVNQSVGNKILHSLGFSFSFSDPLGTIALTVVPIVDFSQSSGEGLKFDLEGARCLLDLTISPDLVSGISLSYEFPTNQFEFKASYALGSLNLSPNSTVGFSLFGMFKSNPDFNPAPYRSLSYGGVEVPLAFGLYNVGVGIDFSTALIGFPARGALYLASCSADVGSLLTFPSFHGFSSLSVALTPTFGLYGSHLFRFDKFTDGTFLLSASLAIFSDKSELFGGSLFVNTSGLTLGLTNGAFSMPSIVTAFAQFFVELYAGQNKFYPVVGFFNSLENLTNLESGTIYVGLSSSPFLLPDQFIATKFK